MRDPRGLSGRHAQEALRKVHAQDAVPAQAPLQAHPDPKVPGANYVEGCPEGRYWVGLAGEVVRTSADTRPPAPSSAYRQARTRYTAAVERVRLHDATPVVEELFAVPDTHVPDAFFVSGAARRTVRWVSPDGEVLDGYTEVDGVPHWDERTVQVRRAVLRRTPGGADLAEE